MTILFQSPHEDSFPSDATRKRLIGLPMCSRFNPLTRIRSLLTDLFDAGFGTKTGKFQSPHEDSFPSDVPREFPAGTEVKHIGNVSIPSRGFVPF